MLEAHRIRFIAVDVDPNLTARERKAGKPVYYGDASREDFLRRCGLETARALVITLDKPSANEQVVAAARRLRPDVTIIARARDAVHARTLYQLGVTTRCRRRSKRACSSPRRRWSTSACRWGW